MRTTDGYGTPNGGWRTPRQPQEGTPVPGCKDEVDAPVASRPPWTVVSHGRDDLAALAERLGVLADRLGTDAVTLGAARAAGADQGGADQGWESSTGASSPSRPGLAAVQVASDL